MATPRAAARSVVASVDGTQHRAHPVQRTHRDTPHRRAALGRNEWLGGLGVGTMIALAWLGTYLIGSQSFEVTPVQSLSFTGPSADMLMLVLSPPGQPWDFDIGLVPGVVLGSFLAAAWGRELKLEGF